MDTELLHRKEVLRLEMRQRLVVSPADKRAERSHRLVRQLTELPAWRASTQVLMYAPLPTEPDLDLLWRDGLLDGKQVAYPRVEGTTMRLYFAASLDELEPTRWGLREPPMRAARETTLAEIDLALVPGLAFDATGGRLGRGGGFYDRLLAERDPTKTRLVGVCFAFQRVAEALPTAAHDVRMDEVCTD